MAVGDRFVRRQSASRSAVSNTSAADLGYDTAVLSETEYEGWGVTDTDAVKVLSAGKYLLIHGTGEAANTSSLRQVGTLVPVVNNVDQGPVALATHRYTRVSGGANEGVSIGFGILDLAANDTVGSNIPGVWGGKVDALGTFDVAADNGGGIQLVKLDDTGQWLHLERAADQALTAPTDHNTTRPWLDSTGTWTKFTWPTEIADASGLHAASSGDVTLGANKKYLITYSAVMWSSDPSRHTDICRLNINGTNVQYQSGYQRSNSSQGPPMSGMYLHETGGTAETLYIEGTQETEGADAGTPQFSEGALQIIELPSSAEWVHIDNTTSDTHTSDLAGTTTWYKTPMSATYRAYSGGGLALDVTNDEAKNTSGASVPALVIGWLNWDRDAGTSGARKVPASTIVNNGTNISYGWGGAYSRGQQSNDDTWHASYACAALVDIANNTGVGLVTRDQANVNNATMGVFASGNRHFIGLQVLDLSTLVAGSGTQALTGSVYSPTPTYPSGTVVPGTVALTGSLNASTPTYPVGSLTSIKALLGNLHASTPSHPSGTVTAGTVALTGAVHASTPTYPTGLLDAIKALTGVLHASTPTYLTGVVHMVQALNGSLHAVTPTYPTGTITPGTIALTGSLHASTPTHPTGVIAPGVVAVTGVLHSSTPTYPTGVLLAGGNALLGNLYSTTPTYPTGVISPGVVALAGALHASTPTHPVGVVDSIKALLGNLHTSTPTHPTGTVTASTIALIGTTHPMSPTHLVGVVSLGTTTLLGGLHASTPTYPAGIVTPGSIALLGSSHTSTPTYLAGTLTAGTLALIGNLYAPTSSYPQGAITPGIVHLVGILHSSTPTYPTGVVVHIIAVVRLGHVFVFVTSEFTQAILTQINSTEATVTSTGGTSAALTNANTTNAMLSKQNATEVTIG